MQSGLYAGNRVRRRISGNMEEKPFRYRDLGSAAYISRGKAVVSAGPLKVGGFVGWVIWLFIHIAFLTGYRNRIGALFTWWFAFTRDIRRERTFTTQQIETLRDVYELPLGPDMSIAAPESAPHEPTAAAAETVTGVKPSTPQALQLRWPAPQTAWHSHRSPESRRGDPGLQAGEETPRHLPGNVSGNR
jgi:hypothetical protein